MAGGTGWTSSSDVGRVSVAGTRQWQHRCWQRSTALPCPGTGRGGAHLRVPLSWCWSSSASLGGTHFPKITPEQQDGSRFQHRLPARVPWHGCRAAQSAQPVPPQPLAPGASSAWKSRQRVLLLPGERQRGAQEAAPHPRLPNGISMSPLKPAVPEQRLRGREWIFSPPGWMQPSELPALHASGACLLEAGKYTVTYFPERAKCIRGAAAAAGASLPPAGPCRQEHPRRWHAGPGCYKGSLVTSTAPAGHGTDTLVLSVLLPAPCGGVGPWIRQGGATSRVPIPAKGVQDPGGQSRGAQAPTAKLSCSKTPRWGWICPLLLLVCVCRDGIRLGRARGAATLSAAEGRDKLLPFSFQMWSQTLTSHPLISSCWPQALLMRR